MKVYDNAIIEVFKDWSECQISEVEHSKIKTKVENELSSEFLKYNAELHDELNVSDMYYQNARDSGHHVAQKHIDEEQNKLKTEFWKKTVNKLRWQYYYQIVGNKYEKHNLDKEIEDIEKLWMNILNQHSFYNEQMNAKCFWVLLLTLMKVAKVEIKRANGDVIKNRFHLFIFQTSGTGKNQSINAIEKIVKVLNDKYREKTQLGKDLIRLYTTSGKESVETWYTRYVASGNKQLSDKDIAIGNAEIYDLILSKEVSFVFVEDRKFKRQTYAESWLEILEGEPFPKQLVGWPKTLYTYPNCNIIGASRPITDDFNKEILKSGLLQRGASLYRNVTHEEMLKMLAKIAKMNLPNPKLEKEVALKINLLCDKLLDIYEKLTKNNLQITKNPNELEKIGTIVYNFCKDKMDLIMKEVGHLEMSEIARTFVMRLNVNITMLAFKNAIVDESDTVNLKHFEQSLKDVDEQIEEVLNLSESIVKNSPDKNRKLVLVKQDALKILKMNGGEMKTSELAKKIAKNPMIAATVKSIQMYLSEFAKSHNGITKGDKYGCVKISK